MTMMAGNAVLKAAKAALQAWNNEERPAVGFGHYDAPLTTPIKEGQSANRPIILWVTQPDVPKWKWIWTPVKQSAIFYQCTGCRQSCQPAASGRAGPGRTDPGDWLDPDGEIYSRKWSGKNEGFCHLYRTDYFRCTEKYEDNPGGNTR